MGMFAWLPLLVLCHQANSHPAHSEDDLLPYLRGIRWRDVEKEFQKDLRLDPSVRPISYDINLNISVRGYRGATRSTFDGYVSIALNTSKPKETIELHSVELNINKAEFILASSVAEISKIEFNRDKETVIFTLPQTLQPTDLSTLKVWYNGTAKMRLIGLFEYWTKPENVTPSGLPTISLVTNCEPTFVEKMATFRLHLTHPTELTAYSNTAGNSNALGNGLNETVFHTTVPLPTYAVAIAITAQPSAELDYKGQQIRAIGRNRAHLVVELKDSIDYVTNLPVFENVPFFPAKTDWLVAEDFFKGAMENPGLIVSHGIALKQDTQIHELLHQYFGNLVTLSTWEQIWINEGFANFFQTGGITDIDPVEILSKRSNHETAIHQKFTYTKSNFAYGHFFQNTNVHYDKAGQLIGLIKRFIGEKVFVKALNRYLIENSYGNGDSEMMIDYLSADNNLTRNILRDWVYQPGVALLSVEEEGEQVIIQQRRFLKTDFIEELRDVTTRWTIPLFYYIDGVEHMKIMHRNVEKFIVNIPANCTFSIDQSYPYLYAVQYTKRKNDPLSRIIADQPTAAEHPSDLESKLKELRENRMKQKKEELIKFCSVHASNKTNEDLWNQYLIEMNVDYLACDITLQTRELAKKFLIDLLLANEVPIHSYHIGRIKTHLELMHPEIFTDILFEEHTTLEYLDSPNWSSIIGSVSREPKGIEKLREIVGISPFFGATFYQGFAKLFEEDFIKSERAKRGGI